MERLVIISGKPLSADGPIVRELEGMPGVAVTSVSPSFVDVEVSQPVFGASLRAFAREHGLEVEATPEAQLMEPMSPFR
jgi:ribulose kinase